ncbi:hypothetical protein N1495_01030 [Streptococcus didelphis]|uniref:hypothetical protein n=1 Tax=Streptococcus TaxID=1301 RepID=UPI000374E099|nr:hypothetical protein [Streptococcus didelphis]WMB29643.1 hypothetical protein N1495_01030 [Streptococcus didelphis]
MKKVEVLVLLVCTSLLMNACTNKKKETGMKVSRQSSVVKIADSSSSSDSKVRSDNQLQVAEDFMQTYIEQSIDLVKLKEKEKALKGYRGDSSLDSAIQSVSSLQVEVVEYQKTKEIQNMASVTLVERELQNVTVYQNGALHFVDVSTIYK